MHSNIVNKVVLLFHIMAYLAIKSVAWKCCKLRISYPCLMRKMFMSNEIAKNSALPPCVVKDLQLAQETGLPFSPEIGKI